MRCIHVAVIKPTLFSASVDVHGASRAPVITERIAFGAPVITDRIVFGAPVITELVGWLFWV